MAKESKEIFAKNLKYLFTKYDIEQNILATKLNVTPAAITEWVKGRKFPRIDTLQLLAENFNLNISNLIEDNLEYTFNNVSDKFNNELCLKYGNKSIELLDNFQRLNDFGQKKAVENIKDLTEIPKYVEKKTNIYEA